jgi:hypothetical protein
MSDFVIIDENKKTVDKNSVNNKSKIEETSFSENINNFLLSLQSIKTKDKVVFYRLLSTMTNA